MDVGLPGRQTQLENDLVPKALPILGFQMVLRGLARAPVGVRKAAALLSIVAAHRPLVGPSFASIEVSTRCNLTCLMCPHYSPSIGKAERSKTAFMDMQLAARVFASAAKMGVRVVIVVGRGEPMMHPDFGGILRLAKGMGLYTETVTNGTLLTPGRIQEAIGSRLDTLGVSLVGASPESYARFHPGVSSRTFQQVLDSLAQFQELKRQAGVRVPKLVLRFIATEGCSSEVAKMVDLGIQLGADGIYLGRLRSLSAGGVASLAPSRAEEWLAIDQLRKLEPEAARAGLKTNVEELAIQHLLDPAGHELPCYAGWFDVKVLVDGSVEYCVECQRTMGNVNERPLEEIWMDPDYQTLRRLLCSPSERQKTVECDCDRCCLVHVNWRIARVLSMFGLAPKFSIVGPCSMLL